MKSSLAAVANCCASTSGMRPIMTSLSSTLVDDTPWSSLFCCSRRQRSLKSRSSLGYSPSNACFRKVLPATDSCLLSQSQIAAQESCHLSYFCESQPSAQSYNHTSVYVAVFTCGNCREFIGQHVRHLIPELTHYVHCRLLSTQQ